MQDLTPEQIEKIIRFFTVVSAFALTAYALRQ